MHEDSFCPSCLYNPWIYSLLQKQTHVVPVDLLKNLKLSQLALDKLGKKRKTKTKKCSPDLKNKKNNWEAVGFVEVNCGYESVRFPLSICLIILWVSDPRLSGWEVLEEVPESYFRWVSTLWFLLLSSCWRHTGQQAPFSLMGSLHSAVGHDSMKQVTWVS